jgi:tetratricopeptide (TPR) repeat protein
MMRMQTSLLLLAVGGMQSLVATARAAPPRDLLRDGETKFRNGQYEEAVELATQVIERGGNAVGAHRLRAAAHEALGRYEQGSRDMDRALEIKPDSPSAYQVRGELHFKAGHVRRSIADFNRFILSNTHP